jgi:hypothetical protein
VPDKLITDNVDTASTHPLHASMCRAAADHVDDDLVMMVMVMKN